MPVSVFDMQSLQHLWGTDELRRIFGEENRIQKWLDFEAALAAAQAELGLIPAAAAQEIAQQARVEHIAIAMCTARQAPAGCHNLIEHRAKHFAHVLDTVTPLGELGVIGAMLGQAVASLFS